LNIGAAVFYSLDNENSNNKLYVYPKFNASYKVVGDLMILCWCRREFATKLLYEFCK
jgi:hypothetical protein